MIFALFAPMSALAQQNDLAQLAGSHDLTKKPDVESWEKPAPIPLDMVRFEFVRANLISTFYHEFAHALIDILELPVLGLEENAADVFSVVVVNELFAEDEVLAINRGAARGFEVDAKAVIGKGGHWDWADKHGTEMQRYYNIVCLTYGADPEKRSDFSKEMKLPQERADTCENEFETAQNGWGPIIERIEKHSKSVPIGYRQRARTNLQIQAAKIIKAEVDRVNARFNLPDLLRVRVKYCDSRNEFYAFYSSRRQKITICTNYIDELYREAPE